MTEDSNNADSNVYEVPADPEGYAIFYTDDERFRLVRLADVAELGVFDTREEAVAAGEADPEFP